MHSELELGLPDDLVAFLGAGRQLDYDPKDCEAGRVILGGLSDVKAGKAWIDPSELCNYSVWNPHDGNNDCYYQVPCVSLTIKAGAYSPRGILVWIPQIKLFATCDTGHGVVWVFPRTSWSQIVERRAVFLGAQWNPDPEVQALLVPWGVFALVQGNPYNDPNIFTT